MPIMIIAFTPQSTLKIQSDAEKQKKINALRIQPRCKGSPSFDSHPRSLAREAAVHVIKLLRSQYLGTERMTG